MKTRPLLAISRDERGATAVIVAVLGAVLIGTTGVALDTGLYFSQQSNLRSVTEAAALSAAAAVNIAAAESNARASLARNGYPASRLKTVRVTLGYYCPDNNAATQSFATATASCPGGTNGNTALRLETTAQGTSYLTRALGGGALIPDLASTATATRIDEAGLEMTTGVLDLDNTVINNLLFLLTGSNINLLNAQLKTLLTSDIDAGYMFDALANLVGETGTYGDLVNRTVPFKTLVEACRQAAVKGNSQAATTLQVLANQVAGSPAQVPLKGLFKLGVWQNTPVDDSGGGTARRTGLRAGLNSYQLLTYALQSGTSVANLNGKKLVGIDGLADITLASMATKEPGTARFAFGPKGETAVSTARIQLHLKVRLLNTGTLLSLLNVPLSTPVQLDLVIQVASGNAKITGITCGPDAATDTNVFVKANSGLLDVFLGEPKPGAMSSTRATALIKGDFTPSHLIDVSTTLFGVRVNVASVDLAVHAGQVEGFENNAISFAQPGKSGNGIIGLQSQGGAAYQLRNTASLADTVRNLTLEPTICIAVICLPPLTLLTTLLTTVGNLLTALAVDPLVDSLLRGLGLQLGYANVWVSGARCGVPVLV